MDTTNLIAYLPFDESATQDLCGNEWTSYGTTSIGETNAIVENALQLNKGYLRSNSAITFGGADFTVSFYSYMNSSSELWAGYFCAQCTTNSVSRPGQINLHRNSSGSNILCNCYDSNGSNLFDKSLSGTLTNARHHFELDYSHDDSTLRVFVDGQINLTQTVTLERLARYIFLGTNSYNPNSQRMVGSIDEFLLYDGVALHTENFTPPTNEDYTLLKLALGLPITLNFDVERIVNNVVFLASNFISYLPFTDGTTEDLCGNEWIVGGSPVIQDGKLYLDGSSYLYTNDVNLRDIFNSDFTLCFYMTAISTGTFFCAGSGSGTSNSTAWQTYSSQARFNALIDGGWKEWDIVPLSQYQNAEHHFTISRKDNTIYFFFDGVLKKTYTVGTFQNNSGIPLTIGKWGTSSGSSTLYMRHFIIYNTCLWTETFTPPTAQDYQDIILALTQDIFSFDIERKLKNNVQVSFDSQRQIVRNVNLVADSQRQIVHSVELINDFERILSNPVTFDVEFSADFERKLKNNVQVSFDSQRQIVRNVNLVADSQRQIVRNVNLITDTQRKIVQSIEFLADFELKISNFVDAFFDIERLVLSTTYADELLSKVKVWLSFDNSTTFDLCANSWSAYGSPSISATNAVSGNALQLDGNSYLQLNGAIELGGQDFTICGWATLDSSSAQRWGGLFALDRRQIRLIRYSLQNNKLELGYGGNLYSITTSTLTERFHFALVYQHSNHSLTVFFNGVAVSTASSAFERSSFSKVFVGGNGDDDTAGGKWAGTIDEFQIFDGIALWAENFTPPTNDYYTLFKKRPIPITVTFDTTQLLENVVEVIADLERITNNQGTFEFLFDSEVNVLRSLDLIADFNRNVQRSLDLNCDIEVFEAIPVEVVDDVARFLRANIILFPIDNSQYFPSQTPTLRAPMLRADSAPVVIPSQARPFQANNTQGIQSFEVLLEEHQLSAQVKFTSVIPLEPLQAISGQFLDYSFAMFVESTRQEGILYTCDCSSSVDELLYSQLNYSVEENAEEYTFDYRTNTFSTSSGPNDYSGDSDDETDDTDDEHTEIVKKALASVHMKEIVKNLFEDDGSDEKLVSCFTDFVSNLDIEPKDVTFSDLISSLFGWSSRIPNKQINIFAVIVEGKEKLYVVERGKEPNCIDISHTKHTMPIIEESILRTFVGSSPDSSYTMNIQLPGKFLCPPPPSVSPDGKTHYNYKNVSGYSGIDSGYALESSVTENDDGSKHEVSYIYDEVNGIYTCVKEISRSYDENGDLIDKKTTIHHRLSPSQQFSRLDDEDGNAIGSNVASNLPGFYNEKITLIEPSTNTKTITIPGNPLVDMSFPFIDIEDFERVSDDLIALNRSIQETVSLTIYDYPHLITCLDRISFNGNEYFLVSNSALSSHNIFCQQSIVMRRWLSNVS